MTLADKMKQADHIKARKLACPKCKGTTFEVYHVLVENFYSNRRPVSFTMEKCLNCGWQTHPTTKRKLNELIDKILKGEKPENGFVYAEKQAKL